jgi:antitoxin VapB
MDGEVKKAKLFANGRSQAVRLPKEFRFDGTEVFIERVGDGVLLRPANGDDRWARFHRATGSRPSFELPRVAAAPESRKPLR